MDEDTGEVEEINQSLWPKLGDKLESVLEDSYVKAHTALDVERRRRRSAANIPGSIDVLVTVQNRIISLCKGLQEHLQKRLRKLQLQK